MWLATAGLRCHAARHFKWLTRTRSARSSTDYKTASSSPSRSLSSDEWLSASSDIGQVFYNYG